MDLNQLLHRHQLALMQLDRASSPEEQRAHSQFARDYAQQIRVVRAELGAPARLRVPARQNAVQKERPSEAEPVACITARVVLTSTGQLPYRVVVSRDGKEYSGHSFATMQEAETFIRQSLPAPAPRSTLYDRKAGE
jgi:hypothetical protein